MVPAARIFGVAYVVWVTIVAVVMMEGVTVAQDVTEPALKAAFIYNFAKFTEWPVSVVPASEPLVMCVLGDAAVSEALERAVKARMLGGHSIAVLPVGPDGPQGACHVLYVSGMTSAQVAKIVAGLRDTSVLTLSDLDGFTELGGIAQFFFQHGMLRFNVQVESVKRARLQISSRLLALSTPR